MKKFFSMLLLLCGIVTLSATLVVNAADPVATFSSATVVNNSSYTKYENDDWVITCGGNSASIGSNNKAAGIAACVLGSYAYVGEPMSFTASTERTSAVISKKPIANVKEVKYSCKTGGNGGYASTEIYLVSSDSSTSGYTLIGTKQTNATSLTFPVNEEGSKYYALVFNLPSGTNFRIDEVVATFMPNEVAGVNYYDVTYDTQGGSTIEAERVAENDSAPKPADPTKEGYIFAGWYKEEACENEFDFDEDKITADTIIYAKWDEDTYTHVIIDTNNFTSIGSGSGYNPYNGSHTVNGVVFESNQVMISSGLQFQGGNGTLSNSIAISGYIHSIKMEITKGDFTVSTSTSALTDDGENVASLNSTNNTFVVENPSDSYFLIKVGSSVGNVLSIEITYTFVEKQTYSVSFNVGDGVFATGKGEDIVTDLGQSIRVTLPTAADLASTPYKYMVLNGWSDSTTTHKPGAIVEVDKDTSFSAVYSAPSNLTIAQALEIADLVGSERTSVKFSTTATIKEIDGNNLILTDSSTEDTIVAYNPSNLSDLSVGDVVTIVGKITTYTPTSGDNSIKEYVELNRVVIKKYAYATAFEAEQTKASLRLDDDNVSIRFGNMISAASHNPNATYGVVVSKTATDLQGLTEAALEELKTAGQAVVCTPVKVNAQGEEDANGEYYQFALVLTNVPLAEFTEVIYAAMYVIDANDKVFMAEVKSASVKSVAAAYLDGDVSNFSQSTIDILNILANA